MSNDHGDRPFDSGALTSAGVARREEMLGELLGSMRRLHRRRRAARRAVATAVLVALVAGLSVLARPPRPAPSDSAITGAGAGPTSDSPRSIEIEIVRTDTSVLARLAARPSSRVTALDDQGLLGELAAMDRPAGLIRMGGRVWLTGDVAEPIDDEGRVLPPS